MNSFQFIRHCRVVRQCFLVENVRNFDSHEPKIKKGLENTKRNGQTFLLIIFFRVSDVGSTSYKGRTNGCESFNELQVDNKLTENKFPITLRAIMSYDCNKTPTGFHNSVNENLFISIFPLDNNKKSSVLDFFMIFTNRHKNLLSKSFCI